MSFDRVALFPPTFKRMNGMPVFCGESLLRRSYQRNVRSQHNQVNDFFHEINWKQVMSGLGVAVAGIVVTAIAGTVLARVAVLVIPAITLLLSGTTVLAALVMLGTAIA